MTTSERPAAPLSFGRQVRRGEEGICILAPVSRTVEDEGTGEKVRALVGFKVASVFDVSQTDGEPLPEAPRPGDLRPGQPRRRRVDGL